MDVHAPRGLVVKLPKPYFGNARKLSIVDAILENGWGTMITAAMWRAPKPGISWALDNGAFSAYLAGDSIDPAAFAAFVDNNVSHEHKPDFIVVPDKVADPTSLAFSIEARSIMPDGFSYYLAVQDGMTPDSVRPELEIFDGIFIGGTKAWKLRTARIWSALSKEVGIPSHGGRFGTLYDLRLARAIELDSVDSSSWCQNPGWVEKMTEWEAWCAQYKKSDLLAWDGGIA